MSPPLITCRHHPSRVTRISLSEKPHCAPALLRATRRRGNGRGAVLVAPDHRGAFLAFRRAAEAGDDGALLNLGVCYDNVTGTRRDRAKAWHCYHGLWRRTQQHAAANNLATWHRDGGNQRRAFSWYQKAADAGDGDAHVALAYAYYYGLGTTKSLARALRELNRADHTNAITRFGQEEALYLRAIVPTPY